MHLFNKEVGGDTGWLLVSSTSCWEGLSSCLVALLVLRTVDGVACVAAIKQSVIQLILQKAALRIRLALLITMC